ncbi:uncharacterized protein LOC111623526 isoform X2 [Centruroides sculpturatus]|uniref:uncharacterized protein LOC111623526 isoform X2 n=1 Tax=Centruroides sculpturatus TaxID=218467 RepID=UPI000C6D06B4|nr:uncharacterized protein LOC111623526 isoform X2 [Centruroides sculpturatus]XP_023221898.1 uncharacterized protein LOC111623526 isoform X2 [Centruroides sculpturatus]XP_023221899.1 uncharacterized protein LOC111623526 isoform X2 [Centruroides sculpturatus]
MAEFSKTAKISIFNTKNEVFQIIGQGILEFGWDNSTQSIKLSFKVDDYFYETNLLQSWVDRENNAYWTDQDENSFRASFESQADIMEFALIFVKGNSKKNRKTNKNIQKQFRSSLSECNYSKNFQRERKRILTYSSHCFSESSISTGYFKSFIEKSNVTLLTAIEHESAKSAQRRTSKKCWPSSRETISKMSLCSNWIKNQSEGKQRYPNCICSSRHCPCCQHKEPPMEIPTESGRNNKKVHVSKEYSIKHHQPIEKSFFKSTMNTLYFVFVTPIKTCYQALFYFWKF